MLPTNLGMRDGVPARLGELQLLVLRARVVLYTLAAALTAIPAALGGGRRLALFAVAVGGALLGLVVRGSPSDRLQTVWVYDVVAAVAVRLLIGGVLFGDLLALGVLLTAGLLMPPARSRWMVPVAVMAFGAVAAVEVAASAAIAMAPFPPHVPAWVNPVFVVGARVVLAAGASWVLVRVRDTLLASEERVAQLSRRDARLRELFESSTVGMAVAEADGRYREVNPALCEMLGRSAEELVGRSWKELTHPDDLERECALLSTIRQQGESRITFEKRYLRADGEVVWAEVHVQAVPVAEAAGVEYFVQVHDITGRRVMEDELSASRAELQALFDRLPVALYRSTPDGRVVSANPALVELLAYPDAAALLDDPEVAQRAHVHPERREHWRRLMEERGVVSGCEQEMVRADGTRIWVSDSARVVRGPDGEVLYYEGALLDITERKQAEVSRQRLARILEATSDLVVATTPAGRVVHLNAAARRFFGCDDVRGDLHGLRLVGRSSLRMVPELIARLSETRQWSGELTLRRADGAEVLVSGVVQLHRDDGGGIAFYSLVARDVSEQRRLAQQLEGLVRAKDEFVASVSHELRTPLTAVVGLTEELRRSYPQFSEQERRELVDLIAEQSVEVAHIVEDLLVAARSDTGSIVLVPQLVELGEEVGAVLRAFPAATQERVTVEGGGVKAWADGRRLRQIVRNLVSNALRYGGDEIGVRVLEDEGWAVLEVSDSGPGLPESEWEAIFEPYRRAHEQPTQPASVGLGLTVSRRLARMMGGDITYQVRNARSVFTVTLPTGR